MNQEIEKLLNNFITEIEPKIKNIDGPDYYISQSPININPELLIIGINPAGDKKLSESNFPNKKPENLINSSHMYLDNPNWKISQKLNHIFSGSNSSKVYKDAVILNYIAINTNNEKDLKNTNLKNIVEKCKILSDKLIYEIIKPKNILLLGPTVAKYMKLNFHHIEDSVLRTNDEKSYLILENKVKNIPHFLMYHPSTPAFNGFEHLEMKKIFFNKIFDK